VGLATEAAELLDAVRPTFYSTRPLNEDNILEEMGDILFYLTALMKATGYTLEDLITTNISKLTARYGEGKASDNSGEQFHNREQDAEMKALRRAMGRES
jgi:NTP pyrophosphatase (non-canonical NTP hydrolase)